MVTLESYNIIRRDRTETEHGGVCVCIKNTIKFTVVDDLEDRSFEALWIQMTLLFLEYLGPLHMSPVDRAGSDN